MEVTKTCALCSSTNIGFPYGRAWTENSFYTIPDHQGRAWKETKDLKQGDIICLQCLNQHHHEIVYAICSLCPQKYKSMFGEEIQGTRCCSTTTEKYIIGEYGSYYDDDKFYFVKSRPEYIKPGCNICDNCIDTLVKKGICTRPR